VTSNAAHPGFARTGLFASGPGGLISLASDFAALLFGQLAADGVRPILFAATSAKANPGGYYGPGGIGELRGAPAPALIMPQARDGAMMVDAASWRRAIWRRQRATCRRRHRRRAARARRQGGTTLIGAQRWVIRQPPRACQSAPSSRWRCRQFSVSGQWQGTKS